MNATGSRTLRTVAAYAVPVVVALALLGLADAMRLSLVNQLTSLLLLAILAMAWNLVSGFGGQFSLGHSIFVGVGGYATAVLLDHLDMPLVPAILLSGLIAAVVGVILAYPMLRLRGPYFAIGTLGLTLALLGWMLNWDFTKRSQGYTIPADATVDLVTLLRITVLVALVTVLAITLIMRRPLGLALLALRDNEDGAISVGVRRLRTLMPTWAISAFLTGLMGAVVAMQKGQLTPTSAFSIQYALDAVVICVIGGLGTLYGPLIGAVVVFALRQYTADFAGWATLIEAIIVILVVRFFPDGVMGLLSRGRDAVAAALIRRRGARAAAQTE